jgi:ABC-type multidrug transport system fused ATPase/permease subunit
MLPKKLRHDYSSTVKTLKDLWSSISKKRQKQLLLLVLLSVLTAILEVGNISALMWLISLMSSPKNSSIELLTIIRNFQLDLTIESIKTISLISFLGLTLISSTLRLHVLRRQLILGANITSDLSNQVYKSVLHRPYLWHLSNNTSDSINVLTKDIDYAYESIKGCLGIISNGVVCFIIAIYMLSISLVLTLLFSVIIVFFYTIIFKNSRASLRLNGISMTSNHGRSVRIVQESLNGIRDVIVDNTYEFFANRFNQFSADYRFSYANVTLSQQVPRLYIETLFLGSMSILIYSLSFWDTFLQKELPVIGALIIGFYRLMQPMQQAFVGLGAIQAHIDSVQKILPFLKDQPILSLYDTRNNNKHANIYQQDARVIISLCSVTFAYQDERDAIQDITLEIVKGHKIGIVGLSGSGKSTMCDLIMNLLPPTSGHIEFYNPHNFQLISPGDQSWQYFLAHVPQRIYLSDEDFIHNIALGIADSEINFDMVYEAAKLANILDYILSLPESFFTILGEDGIRLSGGQRQRVGIARALYKSSEILILDEATSSLDVSTEDSVLESIYDSLPSSTIISVAHKASAVKRCDKIFVMEKGRIIEEGTYEELEANSVYFRKLCNIE